MMALLRIVFFFALSISYGYLFFYLFQRSFAWFDWLVIIALIFLAFWFFPDKAERNKERDQVLDDPEDLL